MAVLGRAIGHAATNEWHSLAYEDAVKQFIFDPLGMVRPKNTRPDWKHLKLSFSDNVDVFRVMSVVLGTQDNATFAYDNNTQSKVAVGVNFDGQPVKIPTGLLSPRVG